MPFRFITKSIHTDLINYPVAIVFMVAPFLLKLGKSSPVAPWLSVVTRVTALLLPALTDHPAGLVRVELEAGHHRKHSATGLLLPSFSKNGATIKTMATG